MRRRTLTLIVLFLSIILVSVTAQGEESEPTNPGSGGQGSIEQSWPDNEVETIEQSWPDRDNDGDPGGD